MESRRMSLERSSTVEDYQTSFPNKMKKSNDSDTIDAVTSICHNCVALRTYMDAKFTEIQKSIELQNSVLAEFIAEQKLMMKKFARRQEIASTPIAQLFPITSVEKLQEVENKIIDDNFNSFVSAIQCILQNDVIKNLSNIINDNIVLSFNLEGTHGKQRFKNYPNLYKAILRATEGSHSNKAPESLLRRAFQREKKRNFTRICNNRKREREMLVDDTSMDHTKIKFEECNYILS